MPKINVSRLFVAVLLPVAAVALTACEPECVDKYDCRSQGAAEGVTLICVDNRCVKAPEETPPEEDAGEDAGEEVDAGEQPDAGEQDAGEIDAGVPDSGTTDAGFVDAGFMQLVAPMSGTQEVPAVTSTNSGTGTFTLNLNQLGDAGFGLQYSIAVTGLNGGGIGNVELRQGPAGVNGPLVLTLNSTGNPPFTGTATIAPGLAADLQAGRTYVQLHANNGTNALRGQVLQSGAQAFVATLTGTAAGNIFACTNNAFDVPACGAVQVVLSPDGSTIDYEGVWDPSIVATMAHIHETISTNVAVPFALVTDGGQGVSGTDSAAALDAGALSDGGYYVNVHSADAGAGLVRGTLVPVK